MKGCHVVHVERYRGEIARLAAQQRDDSIERRLDLGRWRDLVRVRKTLDDTLAGLRVAPFGQLNPCDAARGPCYAAAADGRIEQGKGESRHVTPDLNIDALPFTWRILLR